MSEAGLEQLQKLALFHGLESVEWKQVLAAAKERHYDAGSFLFYQDDPAERIFVMTAGRVRLAQVSDEGHQVIMRVATPGMMIAAIALVEGVVYPVSAEAAEDSRALCWSQAELLALIDRYPVMGRNAMRLLAGHVREFQDRYRELATERVERRLARTIIRLATQVGKKTEEGVLLDIPLTRQDLAEMTGTTLYTVSRILSQWETQGLVLVGRERVVIRFAHGLVGIADDLPGRPVVKQAGKE